MVIRTKSGEIKTINNDQLAVSNVNVLLDYLGIKKDVTGIQRVTQDVQLIASVPFCLTAGENKSIDDLSAGISWTFSTFDLDRYGERIDPAGWDFAQYARNPVIEWAHRYDIPAIGKAENIYTDEKGLHGVLVFNPKEYDPFGWSIGERVKAGVIRAGSVGFRVIEIEIPDKKTAEDGTFLIFRKQELLEFSVCNVPANPFALAKINEQITENKEKCDNATPFWGSFINNLQGE